MKKSLPNFRDKIVSVDIVADEAGRSLENPRFVMHGSRLFLVGTVPRDGSQNNFAVGLRVGVAWDQVQTYLVYDSAKDYSSRVKKYEKR